MSSLTEQDKVRIRHHLGYANVERVFIFALGVPTTMETQFIVESCMDRVLEEAVPELRRIVQVLDSIEQQGIEDHELLAVDEVGEIKVRSKEHEQLDQRYQYWAGALCNLLGIERNPFDRRAASANVSVRN